MDEYEYKVTSMRPGGAAQTADEHLNFAAKDGWRLVQTLIIGNSAQASFIGSGKGSSALDRLRPD